MDIKELAKQKTGIKMEFEPDTRKYFGQQCQDDRINAEFRLLHKNIINQIIQFCNKYNIVVDELHLNADALEGSILYGSWQACTDSYFGLDKFTDEYKDALSLRSKVSNKEFEIIKAKQEPFIYSM